ncbi:MAG TPA: multicopper oxidase domain-containing protein [Flavobacteriales bacterium]|nr:multicopper oxidase domain-containing protein [Flavobacteriales bacterium]
MKKISCLFFIGFCAGITQAQNPLFIPDTLSGTTFNLNVQTGTKVFIGSNNTPTFGYNGSFLGPTLLINKDDSITLNVTNNLTQVTTVHWHGFHVAPENDGGPHQMIMPGMTWSPSFKMRNEAATFWYHPHGEGKTEIQISKGLAGMIIVRDAVEAAYNLPRTYGVDDFPLIVQSKAFDVLYQFMTATHEDSIMMVNGTIDPYLSVPQQVVRLRLLNASADRTYYFGLSDNSNFSLIASDGGLLSAPHTTNRVRLSTGERAEILIDFSSYTLGQQVYLMSYASELAHGIIGADSVGTSTIMVMEGYYDNPLNGVDFNVLRFDVSAPTSSPVTTIPASFAPKIPIPEASADRTRSIHFSADTAFSGPQGFVDGPFLMNNTPFHMDSINIVTEINDTEIWELTNSTMVAHPFHIHDIEFYVLDINGNPPPPEYAGLKDVILVQPNDTVRFITQFTTFSNWFVPYMFHCHLLHHEDDGMMGTFLVVDSTTIGVNESDKTTNDVLIYPNPGNNTINIQVANAPNAQLTVTNSLGELIMQCVVCNGSKQIETTYWHPGVYFFTIENNKKQITKKIIIQ